MSKHAIKKEIGCFFCRNKIPFDLPQEIIDALKQNNLVIFAGAGISTERKEVFPFSLYQDLRSEIKNKKKNMSFEEVASEYCKQPNGRTNLLNKIKERFDYVKSWTELYVKATEFHRELSTIFLIKDIITTTWDDYFENQSDAIPLVTDKDFAFWDNHKRKVLKIHGSINNYGTLVATSEDYKKTYKELSVGIIGSTLKQMLATKTIIFIGYSFGDSDFNRIFDFIKKQMGEVIPHSYLVTVNGNVSEKNSGITIINTDGTYFLSVLKHKLVEEECMLPDEIYQKAYLGLLKIKRVHLDFIKADFKKYPETVYCSSYQEGLMHAFDRVINKENSGEYSDPHHLFHLIKDYNVLQKEKIKDKNYFDVAYIEGYINGLLYFSEKDLTTFPTYYLFGNKDPLFSKRKYELKSKNAKKLHKSAYERAGKMTKDLADGITISHTPFLM